MARSFRLALTALLLSTVISVTLCDDGGDQATGLSSSGKPLIKRPPGRSYRTVASLDGGGTRGIMAARIFVELEQTIGRYLLENPSLLPSDVSVSTVDDFDVNLVDYFDCMAGFSSGAWSALYLASRGGQGASRFVLDDPAIVEKYGVIPTGGAEGLIVMYKEYSSIMFPAEAINIDAGTPLDVTNPAAPGVLAHLYPRDGLERSLEAFLGHTTLADLDTSVMIPALDLITRNTVYFVQNRFREQPVTSSAVLRSRITARAPPMGEEGFTSDFEFGEGKDYYLIDAGTASAAVPILFPAKSVAQAGSDEEEFLMVDGFIPIETTTLPTAFFVASETGMGDFKNIAMLSLGNGVSYEDLTVFANSGAAEWLGNLRLLGLLANSGLESLSTLADYLFYSNPETKPYQYLRIQTSAPVTTDAGMAFAVVDQPAVVDPLDAIALQLIEEHRAGIDAFVRDFIFG